MPRQRHQWHPDRYDVSGNPEAHFVDARKRVLVNRKGIRSLRALQLLEEEALALAYTVLVAEVRSDTPMTCALIRHVHLRIFGDLYDWAGRWRTVRISKPGAAWPPPDFLADAMDRFERDVLRRYPASSLHDERAFCRALAHVQGEFLAIHPFREGNARTIKLLTNLLALQTGRPPLVYNMTGAGRRAYIDAAKAALHRQDYSPLEAVIREALRAATRGGGSSGEGSAGGAA